MVRSSYHLNLVDVGCIKKDAESILTMSNSSADRADFSRTHIILGTDHGGFTFKEEIKTWLEELGCSCEDLGAHTYDESDDYPPIAFAVAETVVQAEKSQKYSDVRGILFCRSGGGMSIAANKVAGIRAVPLYSVKEAIHAKEHNNANVISISGDWLSSQEIKQILQTYLETSYLDLERYNRRHEQISAYERANT
jgi:ribose 5-phosphate isomerase B